MLAIASSFMRSTIRTKVSEYFSFAEGRLWNRSLLTFSLLEAVYEPDIEWRKPRLIDMFSSE